MDGPELISGRTMAHMCHCNRRADRLPVVLLIVLIEVRNRVRVRAGSIDFIYAITYEYCGLFVCQPITMADMGPFYADWPELRQRGPSGRKLAVRCEEGSRQATALSRRDSKGKKMQRQYTPIDLWVFEKVTTLSMKVHNRLSMLSIYSTNVVCDRLVMELPKAPPLFSKRHFLFSFSIGHLLLVCKIVFREASQPVNKLSLPFSDVYPTLRTGMDGVLFVVFFSGPH